MEPQVSSLTANGSAPTETALPEPVDEPPESAMSVGLMVWPQPCTGPHASEPIVILAMGIAP